MVNELQISKAIKLAFSVSDMMDALDVSRATLYDLINAGQIRTYRIGRRRFATRDALIDFQKNLEASQN